MGAPAEERAGPDATQPSLRDPDETLTIPPRRPDATQPFLRGPDDTRLELVERKTPSGGCC